MQTDKKRRPWVTAALAAVAAVALAWAGPAGADEVPPNWPGTLWHTTDNGAWGEGWFQTYGCESYPNFADEQWYFFYSAVFGTGGGYCPSYCPGDVPATSGWDIPWQMYWDYLSPLPNDYAGQACYKFYWSGEIVSCCDHRWRVSHQTFGSQESGGPATTWASNMGCGWGAYDETMIWADFVLGTPLAKVNSAEGTGVNGPIGGFMYMWPVTWGSLGYLVQRAAWCSLSGTDYCGCPLYGWYSRSCYKDILCFETGNYGIRAFYAVTSGVDAGYNWDNNPTIVINDYNMWFYSPVAETRCYYIQGILGSPPCLCCSERQWGY